MKKKYESFGEKQRKIEYFRDEKGYIIERGMKFTIKEAVLRSFFEDWTNCIIISNNAGYKISKKAKKNSYISKIHKKLKGKGYLEDPQQKKRPTEKSFEYRLCERLNLKYFFENLNLLDEYNKNKIFFDSLFDYIEIRKLVLENEDIMKGFKDVLSLFWFFDIKPPLYKKIINRCFKLLPKPHPNKKLTLDLIKREIDLLRKINKKREIKNKKYICPFGLYIIPLFILARYYKFNNNEVSQYGLGISFREKFYPKVTEHFKFFVDLGFEKYPRDYIKEFQPK